jgi:hypothetical protein
MLTPNQTMLLDKAVALLPSSDQAAFLRNVGALIAQHPPKERTDGMIISIVRAILNTRGIAVGGGFFLEQNSPGGSHATALAKGASGT